jgi:hypothetical protein
VNAAPSLTLEQIKALISDLYPQRASETEAEGITDQQKETVRDLTNEPVTLTETDLVSAFYKLDPDSAQGMSGWTNNLIRQLFGRTGKETLKTYVNGYMLPLFNKILAGKMPRAFWTSSRATFIPKANDSSQLRPLGIGEVWYRFFGKSLMMHFSDVISPLSHVSQDFLPFQLGCCVRSGCEIAARASQMAYDSGDGNNIIISLDIQNAYQNVKRSSIMDNILDRYSTLAKLFSWAYGEDSPLFLANGTHVGNAHTGVKQGDPLGAFFFCHGLQPALKEIHSEVVRSRELPNRPPRSPGSLDGLNRGGLDNGSSGVGILAYIDDITLYSNVESAVAVARIAKSVLEKWGFQLSKSKCHFLGQRADELKNIQGDLGFNINKDGLKLLGNPVGTSKYRLEAIGKILQTQLEPLEALHTIRHLTTLAFQIVRKCINSRATYLARVAEPHREAKYLFHLFDLHINAGITCLTGYRSRPGCENFWDVQHLVVTPYLRALPTSLGGLGLPLHGGLAGAYGCLRSRLLTHSFLDRHAASFGSLLAEKSKWSRVSLVESKDIRFWNFFKNPASSQENSWFAVQTLRNSLNAIVVKFPYSFASQRNRSSLTSYQAVTSGSTNHFCSLPSSTALGERTAENRNSTIMDDLQSVRDSQAASAIMIAQHAQDRDWLLSILRDQLGWKDCAAWLLHSSFDKSGAIFTKISASGFFETRKFSNDQFKECLCLRLMLPLIPLQQNPETDNYTCQCTSKVNLLFDRFHCLGCTAFQGAFNTRHKQVVAVLEDAMLTDRLPFVKPLTSMEGTTPEFTLPSRSDTPTRRADLGFVGRENVRFIVDVAVMAPTAKSYVVHHGSHLRMNAAHGHIEQQKETRYAHHTHPVTPSNFTYSLIPFIIDCTGNFGIKTKNFFQEQNMEDHRKKPAIRKIQALIAWYNAEIRWGYLNGYIPPVDASIGKRFSPFFDPDQPRRGRPLGSRSSNSRGREQVAAVINNHHTNNHTFEAIPAVAPDIEGTNMTMDVENELELSTGQT